MADTQPMTSELFALLLIGMAGALARIAADPAAMRALADPDTGLIDQFRPVAQALERFELAVGEPSGTA